MLNYLLITTHNHYKVVVISKAKSNWTLSEGKVFSNSVTKSKIRSYLLLSSLTNSFAYRDLFYRWFQVSFYHLTIIINNMQPWEDVVPQSTVLPWFLSELSFQSDLVLLLLHLHWPMGPTNHKEIPIFLANSTLISNFRDWFWSHWSYYSCTRWNGVSETCCPFISIRAMFESFLMLTELLFDIQVHCYDFYIALKFI